LSPASTKTDEIGFEQNWSGKSTKSVGLPDFGPVYRLNSKKIPHLNFVLVLLVFGETDKTGPIRFLGLCQFFKPYPTAHRANTHISTRTLTLLLPHYHHYSQLIPLPHARLVMQLIF
jgi:hypothetical protein